MHGNRWKSRNPRDHQKIIDLSDTIATKLLEPDGFVFFHFDGDRTWAERSTCENATKFQAFVQAYIEPRVDAHLRKRDALAEKDARMARLRPLVPYYSIEAWVYQNTSEGARLCRERGCNQHQAHFNEWQRERGLLDEVLCPKGEVCFGAEHNSALASQGFPTDEVFRADKSFAAAVTGLLDSTDLGAVLNGTHYEGAPSAG